MPPSPPSGTAAATRARRAVALLAALTVLGTVGFAADLLVLSEASHRAVDTYRLAQSGEDYLVAAYVPNWEHLSGKWSSRPHHGPERILLVDAEDAERVARGETPRHVFREWNVSGTWAEVGFGHVEFDAPGTAHCTSCGALLLVFLKGDARIDGRFEDLPVHQWTWQPGGAVSGEGPILFSARVVDAGLVARFPLWQGAVATLGLATLAAALAWGVLARREGPRRRAARADALDPARPSPTEDMLRLVRLGELYVATISRYFLVSALVILLSGALVMYLALPPVMGALHEQVPAHRDVLASAIFVWAVPFAVLVAGLFWAVEYRRVRRELARWRDLTRRFDEDADRILAAA